MVPPENMNNVSVFSVSLWQISDPEYLQSNYRLDISNGALLEYGNRLAESKKEVIKHGR
jgi:hypothetical protein